MFSNDNLETSMKIRFHKEKEAELVEAFESRKPTAKKTSKSAKSAKETSYLRMDGWWSTRMPLSNLRMVIRDMEVL